MTTGVTDLTLFRPGRRVTCYHFDSGCPSAFRAPERLSRSAFPSRPAAVMEVRYEPDAPGRRGPKGFSSQG